MLILDLSLLAFQELRLTYYLWIQYKILWLACLFPCGILSLEQFARRH